MPSKLHARWTQLPTDTHDGSKLQRSSHTLAIVDNHAFIFGGEVLPRVPVDNHVYVYNLSAKHWESPVRSDSQDQNSVPTARVGVSSAAIGNLIYVWGGRGGVEMSPLPNDLFEFDTLQRTWRKVLFASKEKGQGDGAPVPRSYHAMTASDTHIYVFGGCPIKGRLNDFHCFNPLTYQWTTLPSPNISPRGGSSMAFHHASNKIFLFGGFTGQEQNDLRVFDIQTNQWSEPRNVKPDIVISPRSVLGFVSLTKDLLIAIYGERDPSDIGHAGAGKFWEDVWALKIVNKEGVDVEWEKVEIVNEEEGTSNNVRKAREGRGWFQTAVWNDKIVLSGGLDSNNIRLDDLWVLEFV